MIELDTILRTKKILLVEDDASTRLSMKYLFRSRAKLFQAVSQAEIVAPNLSSGIWDIIICDYRLPGMTGLDFYRLVKRALPECVFILITGYLIQPLVRDAYDAGIDLVLIKPLTKDDLFDGLNKTLRQKKNKGIAETA